MSLMTAPTQNIQLWDELIEFIAAGSTPSQVVEFQPSLAVKTRVAELIEQEKLEELTPQAQQELDQYLMLEHLLRLAKARARQYLDQTVS